MRVSRRILENEDAIYKLIADGLKVRGFVAKMGRSAGYKVATYSAAGVLGTVNVSPFHGDKLVRFDMNCECSAKSCAPTVRERVELTVHVKEAINFAAWVPAFLAHLSAQVTGGVQSVRPAVPYPINGSLVRYAWSNLATETGTEGNRPEPPMVETESSAGQEEAFSFSGRRFYVGIKTRGSRKTVYLDLIGCDSIIPTDAEILNLETKYGAKSKFKPGVINYFTVAKDRAMDLFEALVMLGYQIATRDTPP